MLIEYRGFNADLRYCAKTKSYYGEVLQVQFSLSFLATNRKDAIAIMQRALDEYLAHLQIAALGAVIPVI